MSATILMATVKKRNHPVTVDRLLSALQALLVTLSLGLFPIINRTAGAQEKSAIDLIRFLTYQSDRPHKESVEMGLFGCGQATADVEAATSLARLGDAAMPEIEKALDAMENRGGPRGSGSMWVQLAYARIKGSSAYPRLRRLEDDSKKAFERHNLDSAIALSFALTSYVSNSRLPIRSISCTRGPEPRDALDQLILGWERNDRSWLERSLGPRARTALRALLQGRTWAAMRSELWPAKPDDRVAVGYRLNIPGHWSEPPYTLKHARESRESTPSQDAEVSIDTVLTDSSGTDCGTRPVALLKSRTSAVGMEKYLIDNSNLRDLLRLIGSCAARASERP